MTGAMSRVLPWIRLLPGAALFAGLFEVLGMPAGLLLGPLLAAVLFASRGGALRLPSWLAMAAQAMIGLMIARSLTLPALTRVAQAPWMFLGTTIAIVVAATCLGAIAARMRVLPGTAAIWGLMPGAATAMVLMARDEDADWQLVAVMAYLRVMLVAGIASILALSFSAHSGGSAVGGGAPGGAWFPDLQPRRLCETVVIALIGVWGARRLGVPAAPLLGPMFLGALATGAGLAQPQLPGWLLGGAYLFTGMRIGLGFTPPVIATARKAAPALLAAVGSLIAFCGGCGFLIAHVFDVDPLTAYLATSPGGADFAAVIATTTDVDVSFVMSMQVTRLLAVIVVGPWLARMVARYVGTAELGS